MNNFCVDGLYAQKAADVCGIPVENILRMRDRHFLDEQELRNYLIRYDCYALLKTKKFTEQQIYERLSGIYNVGVAQIQKIIKLKPKRIFYCKRCGHEVTRKVFKQNNGMCNRCSSQSIIL